MDAVKFLKEVKRMCEGQSVCVEDNKVCPIVCYRNGYCIGPALKTIEEDNFPKIVNIVEQWSRKTRSSEFLKYYPDATVDCHGMVDICPKAVDKNYTPVNGCCNTHCDGDTSCDECCYEYWTKEVE